ncbi:hypothetical protein [Luteimonas sp. e5]
MQNGLGTRVRAEDARCCVIADAVDMRGHERCDLDTPAVQARKTRHAGRVVLKSHENLPSQGFKWWAVQGSNL